MSFRRKLLATFALTVFLSVAAVTWIVSALIRRAYDHDDESRRASLVAQFQREFHRRGQELENRMRTVAASEVAFHIAAAVNRGLPDYASYISETKNLADNQQLDFLEFVDQEGTILSSAQSPASFGYKESTLPGTALPSDAFLRSEGTSDQPTLALSAVKTISVGDKSIYAIGGKRLDQDFLASLELPSRMRALLYQESSAEFNPALLITAQTAAPQRPELLSPLLRRVRQTHAEAFEILHWTGNPVDDEFVQAIPLDGLDGKLLGVLLVGNSRRPYVELRQRIESTGLLVGGTGIVLAILFSGWIAARFTRPVEQLAEAAMNVAAGDWDTQVPVISADEVGVLAESFNRMTRELLDQRDRALQAERVAAWRELARRLAHELKNPLFPLQLTVENLIRAREQSPELFDEIFRESSSTLLAEISNLKGIISRFSDFSKMPQPELRSVDLNQIVAEVISLFHAQFHSPSRPIRCTLDLSNPPITLSADPELLHRALSNLVLNAIEAMPQGGELLVRTWRDGHQALLSVSDSGTGLTSEECSRLFTPYYTTKTHGTGLGLAIVQSVISDHRGRITVRSEPDRGTTFIIELPEGVSHTGDQTSSAFQ